ncbi:MAG: TIGR01777 family protein [Flavobacteriales bacterium]|nr:TIGR01777 family protein [Flavobacteriales bacterium]
MKILITGKTGLIGSALSKILEKNGHYVHYLSTSPHKVRYSTTSKGFSWNPSENKIDKSCLDGVEVIIHLAGASVAKRWTASYKKEILESRIQSTELLINTLKNTPHQVKQVISASAIGIYPSSYTTTYDETNTASDNSFLHKVSKDWEEAVSKFNEINIPTCIFRVGIVLSKRSSALTEMAKPIALGLGAPFGNGKQHQSWIHINDLARLFNLAVEEKWQGTYNAVAPTPSTNKEITKKIAKLLRKPLFLPAIPRFVMRLILGEMHTLIYDSQRVSAQKILDKGFRFKHETIDNALKDLLG